MLCNAANKAYCCCSYAKGAIRVSTRLRHYCLLLGHLLSLLHPKKSNNDHYL